MCFYHFEQVTYYSSNQTNKQTNKQTKTKKRKYKNTEKQLPKTKRNLLFQDKKIKNIYFLS